MGNGSSACRRCLRGGEAAGTDDDACACGSRLIVAAEEFSDTAGTAAAAGTPAGSEATGNGSNNTGGGGTTESESLVPPGSSGGGVRALPHAAFPFTTDEASMAWLRANRVLFLMRGLPGSGKSTLARLLCQQYPGSTVCSADKFFTDRKTGEYRFVASKLKDAHAACNNAAYDAMSAGKSPVLVDNTNVRRWEFQFYTDLAVRFGYVLLVVVPKTPWRFDAQELANHTSHSVPLEVIEQRLGTWEAAHPIYYAWFLDASDSARLLRLARDFIACLGAAVRAPNLPANSAEKKLLHVTARFCGHRGGAGQQELVAQVDYHNRPDVQAALGRVFPASVSAVFVTPRCIGFKVDLTDEQLALWDHDASESPAQSQLPRGSRAHVTLATGDRVPAVQAGLDLLDILAAAASRPEPGPDDLVLMTEWGFARGCGPNACLLTLDEPIALSTMFASSY